MRDVAQMLNIPVPELLMRVAGLVSLSVRATHEYQETVEVASSTTCNRCQNQIRVTSGPSKVRMGVGVHLRTVARS
jgi:hypothetical protein